jgi:hypothetical protein
VDQGLFAQRAIRRCFQRFSASPQNRSYQPFAGNILITATRMPIQQDAWAKTNMVTLAQAATELRAGHFCSFSCFLRCVPFWPGADALALAADRPTGRAEQGPFQWACLQQGVAAVNSL